MYCYMDCTCGFDTTKKQPCSMEECTRKKQIRYWGKEKIDPSILDLVSVPRGSNRARMKSISERTAIDAALKKLKYEIQFVKKKERKEQIKDEVAELLDRRKKVVATLAKINREMEGAPKSPSMAAILKDIERQRRAEVAPRVLPGSVLKGMRTRRTRTPSMAAILKDIERQRRAEVAPRVLSDSLLRGLQTKKRKTKSKTLDMDAALSNIKKMKEEAIMYPPLLKDPPTSIHLPFRTRTELEWEEKEKRAKRGPPKLTKSTNMDAVLKNIQEMEDYEKFREYRDPRGEEGDYLQPKLSPWENPTSTRQWMNNPEAQKPGSYVWHWGENRRPFIANIADDEEMEDPNIEIPPIDDILFPTKSKARKKPTGSKARKKPTGGPQGTSYCVRQKKWTANVPGSERIVTSPSGRKMMKSICAECGITKTKFVKRLGN